MHFIEVCCPSIDDVAIAVSAGAQRVELCSALSADGLTPSAGLVAAAAELTRRAGVELTVLVRSDEGEFTYSPAQVDVMARDIEWLSSIDGVTGVTIGALTPDGTIDFAAIERWIGAPRRRLDLTFHRAFDRVPDKLSAARQLRQLGFTRILTAGGFPGAAIDHAAELRSLVEATAPSMIMPAGGVRSCCLAQLRDITGALNFHSSARTAASPLRASEQEILSLLSN